MPEYLLRARGISKAFEGVQALDGVDLEIRPGEIHCLAGENGCGKSTLIKVISGAHLPDAGTIEFDGKPCRLKKPMDAINLGIQVIYQDFSIFPNLTVTENLAFNTVLAAGNKLVNKRRMDEIAREALSKIDFKIGLDRTVDTLSVAEKQMVAICRALMSNARLIIMDEPTTALTRKEVNALFAVIEKLKARGIAILFVSHKLNEVFEISDRFTILRSGRLVKTGLTSELDDRKFTYYMTGREFDSEPFSPDSLGPTVFAVNGLSAGNAFKDVSFALRRGEILGITGLLDSGRAALAPALFGLIRTTGGKILKNGAQVKIRCPRDAIKLGIGYVPEDRLSEGLFLPRSIGDNTVISKIDRLTDKLGRVSRTRRKNEIAKWMKELSIASPSASNPVSSLSGGNQQRVALAKWLACEPDVLILNGPTVGVDIGSKHDIHMILRRLAENGMGIIIISDDIPELIENCSSLLVMKNGGIAARLDPSAVTEADVLSRMI